MMRGIFPRLSLMAAALLLVTGPQVSPGQDFDRLIKMVESETATEGISLLGKGPQVVELEEIVQDAEEAPAEAADSEPPDTLPRRYFDASSASGA